MHAQPNRVAVREAATPTARRYDDDESIVRSSVTSADATLPMRANK